MKTVMSAADRKRALKKVIRDSDQARRTIAANRKALNGEETVDIHVNVDELYDPLSMHDQRRLAGEIYEFIEDSVDLYSSLVPIRAILHGVPEEDRGGVPALIRAHYERNLQENLWERRENTLKMPDRI